MAGPGYFLSNSICLIVSATFAPNNFVTAEADMRYLYALKTMVFSEFGKVCYLFFLVFRPQLQIYDCDTYIEKDKTLEERKEHSKVLLNTLITNPTKWSNTLK